jgi:methionine--tRNA ligase beta chain
MKPIVQFDTFAALDIRVGKVLSCEPIEKSEKLYRLKVDFGEEGERTILSGIQKFYTPEELIGTQFVFAINLEPRKMMGEESQGMILAAEGKDKPSLLIPKSETPNGAAIR